MSSTSTDASMERNDGIRKFLLVAPVYRAAQRAIGGDRAVARVRDEVIRSTSTTEIVDIGCGTADMAEHITFRSYVGFDPNPPYIAQATERLAPLGERVRLFVGSIGDADLDGRLPERADLAMAIGVLHHLDDDLAHQALVLAARLTGSTGRFTSFDPGFVDGQPRIARFLAGRDRGQHVRTADALCSLVSAHFSDVTVRVHHDILRVPYTHIAVDASNASSITARSSE
jgi:SAM-dependent methyltransferase